MTDRTELATLSFPQGFNTGRQPLDPRLTGTYGQGTANMLFLADGDSRPWGGLDNLGTGTGSRIMVQVGSKFGGIKDIGMVQGAGSFFLDLGASLWGIGAGQTSIQGVNVAGFTLNSTLQVLLSINGSYTAATSGPFDAGLGQPSAPDIGVVTTPGSGYQGLINGPVSAVIARLRLSTGARSIGSVVSAVVSPVLRTVRLTFPLASAGQDAWAAFWTQQGFGGVGLEYRLAYMGSLDIPESLLTTVVTGLSTITGDATVSAAVGTFQQSWVGYQIVLETGSPDPPPTILSVAVDGSSVEMSDLATATGTTSADINSMVDGIPRSLEFDYQDGDLVPIVAWTDDYPPPAGTHACRLENVMNVIGCYSDAESGPTTTNPGTCIAVSLPNFYESYKPRHLLFLPEQVVTVLSRPQDSYSYIACRNSVHAIQYVGFRDGPACSITTPLPDIGIAYPHNWCQFNGRLALYPAKGNLMMMSDDGTWDDTFDAPVRNILKNWEPQFTTVGWNPQTMCLVVANGRTSLNYCLQNGNWSGLVYHVDAGVTDDVISCVTSAHDGTQGQLVMTIGDDAFLYDQGADTMQTLSVTNWYSAPNIARAKTMYEVALGFENDLAEQPLVISVHRNLNGGNSLSSHDVAMTVDTNTVNIATAKLNPTLAGMTCSVFAEDIGGTGVDYIIGTIENVTGSSLDLVDMNGGPINAQVEVVHGLCVFAYYAEAVTYANIGQQHLPNVFPNMTDARSYAISVWMKTNAETGQIFQMVPLGTVSDMSQAVVTG